MRSNRTLWMTTVTASTSSPVPNVAIMSAKFANSLNHMYHCCCGNRDFCYFYAESLCMYGAIWQLVVKIRAYFKLLFFFFFYIYLNLIWRVVCTLNLVTLGWIGFFIIELYYHTLFFFSPVHPVFGVNHSHLKVF